MKNHCIKFHERSGLKHGDTLIEKTSMLRQKKSGKIKKVKSGTLFNRRMQWFFIAFLYLNLALQTEQASGSLVSFSIPKPL
jgi:hypothetical protein